MLAVLEEGHETQTQCFKTRTGPAGQPGLETGPGGGKNLLKNWFGKTQSTRDSVHPVKPEWDPVKFFFTVNKWRRFWPSKMPKRWRLTSEEERSKINNLIGVVSLWKRFESPFTLCFLYFWPFSYFWHEFQFQNSQLCCYRAQSLASISIVAIDSLFVDSFAAQSPQVCFSSSISIFSSASQLNFSSLISTSAKKKKELCCLHDEL